MTRLGRRDILIGSITAALMARLGTACDDATVAAPLASIRTTTRALHVDLRRYPKLTPEQVARVQVHVAGQRFDLVPHTDETRLRFFEADASKRDAVSHFAEAVTLSAEGAQSYRVGFATADGMFATLFAGIHVMGEDPSVICDETEMAVYAVYHTPALLTLDHDSADAVIAHIQATDGFFALVTAISIAGDTAVTPDKVDQGDTGWISAELLLDDKGQRIPAQSFKTGENLAGKSRYRWQLDEGVAAAASTVVAQALDRIHSDAALEGKKYITSPGIAARAKPASLALVPVKETPEAFVFPDQGRLRGRRSLTVEGSGPSFKLSVSNPNAVGVFVSKRVIGADKKPITKNGATLQAVGYVPGTYYPAPSTLFGPSSGEFDLELPPGAIAIELVTTAFGANLGDWSELDEGLRVEAIGAQMVGGLLSAILDFLLPTIMLGLGVGGETAKQLTRAVVKELVKGVFTGVLVDLAKTILVTILNKGGGKYSVDDFVDFLKDLGKTILNAITSLIGKGLAAGIAVVIAAVASEAAVESVAEDAIPIAGWVLKAAEVAADLIQLGIEIAHIAEGQAVLRSTLTGAHPVSVILHPELDPGTKQRGVFPPAATTYAVSVTLEGHLPIEAKGTFDPNQKAFTVELAESLPLAGKLTAEVRLYDPRGSLAGKGSVTVDNGATAGKLQEVDLDVQPIAVPLTPSSTLTLKKRLVPDATKRVWLTPPGTPKVDESELPYAAGVSASSAIAKIAYGFEAPMPCAGAARVTQVQVADAIDATNVKGLACGVPAGARALVGESGVASVLVSPTKEGALGVFAFDPAAALPTELSISNALGELRGGKLRAARLHAAGYVIALTDLGVEVVRPKGQRSHPQILTRKGHRAGQIATGVAVAPLRGVLGYALLEQGERRVQALDFDGNPIAQFGKASVLALPSDAGRTYLDLEVDAGGNLWVLSYLGNGSDAASFVIHVFDRTGNPMVTFSDVPARALSVDALSTLYTLDAEKAVGPGGYAEPIVSQWVHS